jgi:hypothetical protein
METQLTEPLSLDHDPVVVPIRQQLAGANQFIDILGT